MALISGGELVVRALQKAGVDALFALHGAHIDTIFQGCLDNNLPIFDTRHEAAAGHAAEGYARAGRRLGVALVTAGGGFTNVTTPLANAFLDRTPLLILAGSGALRDSETNTLQAGVDQVAMATPVTKWAHRVMQTEQIPRLIAQGIRIALSPPRGPVFIDLPWDILMNQVDETSVEILPPSVPKHSAVIDRATAETVLALIAESERPVIILGSEATWGTDREALRTLTERLGVPVFSDTEALGLLSDLGEANCGLVQGLYTFKANDALPDAVVLLGARFGLYTGHGSGTLIPLSARIAQVDPDARELARLQHVELSICADVVGAIRILSEVARNKEFSDRSTWRARAKSIVDARLSAIVAQAILGQPLHPFAAVQLVAQHVNPSTVLVGDGAATFAWMGEVMSQARPREYLTHGYLGSMGVGFGNAIGAQVLAKSRGETVLLVTGDGAVGYSLAEFDTAVRHQLPLIVIVMNNRSWGATQHFQEVVAGRDRVIGTRLENGSYHEVAVALGADGYYAEDLQTFEATLRKALDKRRPACINVRVDLSAMPPEELILMGQNPF